VEAITEIKRIIGGMSFIPFETREVFQNGVEFIAESGRGVHDLLFLLDYLHGVVSNAVVKNHISRVKISLITGITLSEILGGVVEEA
jgi:hypothetical protein